MRFRTLTLLIVAQFAVCAAAPARAETSLRHLEYSVNSTVDGKTLHGTIRLDLRAVRRDQSFDFDVEDDVGGEGSELVSVGLDPRGGMNVFGANGLRHEEAVLLYFFALSHENMTGVDVGDHWVREIETAGGNQITQYTVMRANGNIVDLRVARAFGHGDDSNEDWRGRLLYDSASIVPVAIDVNGRDGRLSLKLTHDSFKRE